MSDMLYETLQKMDSERCMSPHDLNDSKWSQMSPNDFDWSLKQIDLELV